MRGSGQIRELARVALPDVGVITNIAPVHLELVGTVEDVAAAKAELIEELHGGTAVVPADEPLLERHVRRLPRPRGHLRRPGGRRARRGEERRGDGTHVLVDAFGHRGTLDFSFTGGHYLRDALAAAGRLRGARLPPRRRRGRRRAGRLQRPARRRLRAAGGGLLLNDAYNANPVAMTAAVDHLVSHRRRAARRWPCSATCTSSARAPTRTTAPSASTAPPPACALVAVGELARDYLTGAPGERWFATVDECIAALPEVVPAGSAVLVKASRACACERVAEALGACRDQEGASMLRAMGASVRRHGPDARHRAGVHPLAAAQRVRPEHPRGGPRGPQDQGGHADHGRRAHLVRRPRPVPHLQPLLGGLAHGDDRRPRQRRHRLRRRLDQDRAQALAGPLGALQAAAAAAALAVHRLHRPALRRRSTRAWTCRSRRSSSSSAPSASTRSSS